MKIIMPFIIIIVVVSWSFALFWGTNLTLIGFYVLFIFGVFH